MKNLMGFRQESGKETDLSENVTMVGQCTELYHRYSNTIVLHANRSKV